MSPMFTCLQVILRHSGIDCLMISRAKLIPVVLGGIATLETLETKWVLPKNRPGPAPRPSLMSPVVRGSLAAEGILKFYATGAMRPLLLPSLFPSSFPLPFPSFPLFPSLPFP